MNDSTTAPDNIELSPRNERTTSDSDQPIAILGRELTENGVVDGPVGIPIHQLKRHVLIGGTTGSGKTTTATWTATTAAEHTDGAVIVINPKQNDWLQQIMRAEYRATGSLDHVAYFNGTQALTAISFFDIRPMVAAGIPRRRAVTMITNHFLTLLDHVKPDDFNAIRSPDVIRYLITALFDPVHGDDAFPLSDLTDAIYALRTDNEIPEVSTDWATELLESLQDGHRSLRQQILQGAVTRVEKFSGSGTLRPLFEHCPDDPDDAFRFTEWLDRDVMLLFDLGGMDDRSQRVLANTYLSLLWRGLQRRRASVTTISCNNGTSDPPTSFLCIDELSFLGLDDRLPELLALGREYGLGVLGMLQYPGQLANTSPELFNELLNNVNAMLMGRIPAPERIAERLAHSEMPKENVQFRLGSLPDARWLFYVSGERDRSPIQTHTIAEAPLPLGHPEGQWPLSDEEYEAFSEAVATVQERTAQHFTVPYDDFTEPGAAEPILSDEVWSALTETNFSTVLPLVDELPGAVSFDHARDAIRCGKCGGTYATTIDDLLDAVACDSDYEALTRDDVPPVTLDLAMTTDEIADAPLQPLELIAIQILYNVAAGRYDRREIDPVFDPCHKALAPLGIDSDLLNGLVEKGYLRRDQLREFLYYSVTTDGRKVLNENHRRGIDWGHGVGDLTESLLHIVMVDTLARYIRAQYVSDPKSPATTVHPYYEPSADVADSYDLDAGTRFDVVALDDSKEIHIIGEAERANHDRAIASIRDFDQIAAVDPAEALWVVPSTTQGHDAVLQPLANPPTDHEAIDDSAPRIPAYSENTKIPDISGVDTPGMTGIHMLRRLRDEIPEPTLEMPKPESNQGQ